MELRLEYGANRNPALILDALIAAGIQLEGTVRRDTWPDDLELQASGDLEFPRLVRAIRAVGTALCPEDVSIPVRIVRGLSVADLLFAIPCDDLERAAKGVPDDIRPYEDEAEPFRHWFRGQWMGADEENRLTEEELSSAPLTAKRILSFLDPPDSRDWRPIQHYLERHASCSQLVNAMATAQTSEQKWRLAYAFHRRGRSCEAAISHLIGWLGDVDRKVREEAADSLGGVVLAVRDHRKRAQLGQQAGAALLAYVNDRPEDNLYFARTALGATGYEPARSYLEELARKGSGSVRESAERGLANLDQAALAGGPAVSQTPVSRSRASSSISVAAGRSGGHEM